MISLFSLNESDDKPQFKSILSPKKPTLWIVLASAVVIITSAALSLSNALLGSATAGSSDLPVLSETSSVSASVKTSASPIPADVIVVDLKMKSSDDSYIADFEAAGEMMYDWITDSETLAAYVQTLKKHYTSWTDLNEALRKYDAEYFESAVLMPVILRSDSNVSCFYTGHSLKHYAGYTFAENYGLIQTFTFSIGTSSSFCLEYSQLKNDEPTSDDPTWWISFVEFRKSDLKSFDLQEPPILTAQAEHGNTDQISLHYEEIYCDSYVGFETDIYLILGFDDQEKTLLNGNKKIIATGSDFIFISRMIGVLKSDGWQFINVEGGVLSDYFYTDLIVDKNITTYSLGDQLIAAKRDGKWVLMYCCTAYEATDAVYDEIILDYSKGVPEVISVVQGGKYGAISDHGKVLVSPQYDFLLVDYDNDLYVLKDGQWGLITVSSFPVASAPDWTAEIPEEIINVYTYFNKPVYEVTDFEGNVLNWFSHNNIFFYLANETGTITNLQMQVFATRFMPDYDWETGNTRAEYDAVTMKYFGKTLTDYTGNTMFELVPGTDLIRPTGWSLADGPGFVLLMAPLQKEGEVYTGLLNCYYLNDNWMNAPYTWE
ncbi:MAG TPA: hypothetical protein PLV03_11095, partial [Clostridiales bacterium]|nr:hypothetical protein [Clostridiales bacterium]